MSATTSSYGIQLWVDLYLVPVEGGPPEIVRLDVIRCAASFPLNDRPKCSLAIVLGRRADDVSSVSAIHRIVRKIRNKQKAYVYMKVDKLDVPPDLQGDNWPADPFVVFEGETTGFGYQRTANSVEYVLNLEHWLGNLAYSSMISAISSPSNPAQLIFDSAVVSPSDTEEGVRDTAGFTGLSGAQVFITPETVADDLWGQGIQPWLISLTRFDTIVDALIGTEPGQNLGDGTSGNAVARLALERIEPRPSGVYTLGVPLDLDPAAYSGTMDLVAGQIEFDLGDQSLNALASSTMWDKLIQYTSTYMLALVPLVDKALVVPYMPGLRKAFATIRADEYEFGKITGDMPAILRGVGIFGGPDWEAGGELPGDVPISFQDFGPGGYYQGASSGLILFKRAPTWMIPSGRSLGSDESSGAGGLVHSNAISAGIGNASLLVPPSQQAADSALLMDKYAQCLYIYEVLKARAGDISGKLRFDIAPGSTIKIESCGEQFLGVSDQLGEEIWAAVMQVDFVIDAEAPRCSTSFHVAHLRGRDENELEGTSIEAHPLWKTQWYGAPLIKF